MSELTDAQGSFVVYYGPGASASKLMLPDNTAAVVRRNGAMQVLLPPGPHVLRNAWDALLGRDAPATWLVPLAPFALHPHLNQLLAYDNVLMEADLLLQARISDPLRFWRALVAGRPGLSEHEVRQSVERELQPVLRTIVSRFLSEVLQHQPEAVRTIQGELVGKLRVVCDGWGVQLFAATDLGFWPALNAVVEAERAQDVARRLAEIELQSKIDALENEEVLRQAKEDLGLTAADEAELRQRTAEDGTAAALTEVLDAKLTRMQEQLDTRLDALAGIQPVAAAVPVPSQRDRDVEADDRLTKWIAVLRVTGAALTLAATAGAIWYPEIIQDGTALRLAAAGLGFIAAIAAFVSAYFLHRRLRQRRAEASRQLSRSADDAERQERMAQERGVRRYLEQRLRQVSSNCQQTWQRVYERDLELATGMRKHCTNAYSVLADEVMAADYPTSAYLSRVHVPADDLAQMLLLSQGVLDDAQAMVDLSQNLYQAALAGDLETVRRGATRLDEGRLAIENRFAERERFITLSN